MDRCYALVDKDGYALRGKKVGIVMTYGDRDPFSSGAVNAFRTFHVLRGPKHPPPMTIAFPAPLCYNPPAGPGTVPSA
jgi:hypothetical protein